MQLFENTMQRYLGDGCFGQRSPSLAAADRISSTALPQRIHRLLSTVVVAVSVYSLRSI